MYAGRLGRATSSASGSSWSFSLCCGDSGFRPYGFPVSGLAVRAAHGDDELPPSASLVQIADGVGDLAQRVRPVDHRGDLAGGDEFLQDLQVRVVRLRRERPQVVAHEG